MSSNQTQMFGGGLFITDPRHMPHTRINDANLFVKDAVNTVKASNNAAFFTALALQGAASAITVADTFVTLLNYSGGGGFLFHVVAPTHSGNNTQTIEYTVDGAPAITIANTAVFAAQSRLVMGAITPGAPTVSNAGTYTEAQVLLPGGYGDIGFQTRIGGINSRATGLAGLIDESVIMANRLACLRWEQSIQVRVKNSGLSAVAVDKQCGCAYKVD